MFLDVRNAAMSASYGYNHTTIDAIISAGMSAGMSVTISATISA
ncbi:hypothetical protein MHH28_24875 [Paenibacillus sp. FSL K6-1217]